MKSPLPMRPVLAALLSSAALVLVAACAAAPLTLYTLDPGVSGARDAPLGREPVVIEVRRVSVPDYLDSEDILVRTGSSLTRSAHGRLASRLPVEVTDFLTARLAKRRPDALVTDQPQTETPAYRLVINLSVFDVESDGSATLEGDWLVLPGNRAAPVRRDRARIRISGPVATDQDVVSLEESLLGRLADRIDLSILD